MGFFKRCRAKRAAKKQLKVQSKESKNEEVILKEEKVNQVKAEEAKKVEKKTEEKTKPVETKKLEEKPVVKEEVEKETKPRYHVAQNKTASSPNYKKWGVRLSGSKKTIKFHNTQAEAIKHAEELAKTNDTTIVIHKLDGKIRKQNY